MKKILQSCIFLMIIVPSFGIYAQERTVTGKVTSSNDGVSLPGVNVIIKGTATGTSTDANGIFTLPVSGDAAVLSFSFIGFITQEVSVGNRSRVDISLETDTQELSEVVIVAYGIQDKKNITGAIASVKSESFKNQPVLGLDQALQGRVAGVQVSQNSGTPGGGVQVRVRGATSISASNEPLYVVDGVPINAGSYSQIGVGNQQLNALNDINPNDIESIEVLKDAASASLYGSRAANGVVLISTKRGKAAKTQINFNAYWGSQSAWNLLEPVSGPEFVNLLTDALVNRYGAGTGTTANPQGVVNADGTVTTQSLFGSGVRTWASPNHLAAWYWGQNPALTVNGSGFTEVIRSGTGNPIEIRDVGYFLDPSTSPSTNWIDQIFQTAPIANYELSMNGGNEKTKFLFSGGYFKQDGIIVGSGYERLSGRVNLDNRVSDKFSFGSSTAFSRAVNNRINNDNNIFGVLSTAVLTASDIPAYTSSGAYAFDPSNSTDNPLAQAYEPANTAINNRLLSNVFGEFSFNNNFSLRSSIGVDFIYFTENRFIPTTARQGLPNGQGQASTSQDVNWINENILRYNKNIGLDHTVDVLIGTSFQESNFNSTFASVTGFPFNSVSQLSAGSTKVDASTSATSWALVSYFAKAAYSYKGKYILNAALRRDGSSRFGSDVQYGNFPSISAAWNAKDESFLSNVDAISNLKVRASWGITGNQEFGNFSYAGLYGIGNNYNLVGGSAPSQLQNTQLSWEATEQYDIGIEIGLLKKVNITVDYYNKFTSGLLLNRPILAVSGFSTLGQNIGEMENKGFEIGINATPISTSSGFTWTSDFNISFNRNSVVSLSKDVLPFASGFASWVEAGHPLGTFRGNVVDGIFQTQEEINALNATSPSGVYQSTLTRPGDFKFRDLNGDGVITSDDQKVFGNAQPKYIGGWTNSLAFKGIDFSFFFQFVQGNKIWNHNRVFAEGMNSIFGQYNTVLDRWTPSNTDATLPRAVFGDPNNNRRNSDHWLEDGSFVRLKNISLGYSLPTSIIERIGLSRLRVYAAAQNLITITDYSGFDPEVSTFSTGTAANAGFGTDFLTFPQAKTITFGVNLTLK
jgi:TonB-dependent starch-binding outer membrane protein SusC